MSGLPERFFDAARRVLLKESDRLDFDAADILRIAQDTAMHAEFREILRGEVNNPQLADIVVHYLDEIASELESRATISDIRVELIDRAGMAVSASVTVAAVGMLAVGGFAIGPSLVLAVGVIGLVASGAGRTILRLGGHKHSLAAERVRRLLRGMEGKRP